LKTLLSFTFENNYFELLGSSWSGAERLYVDDQLVSKRRNYGYTGRHEFTLANNQKYSLSFAIDFANFKVVYNLYKNELKILSSEAEIHGYERLKKIAKKYEKQKTELATDSATLEAEQQNHETSAPNTQTSQARKSSIHWVAIIGLILKLFKSAKAIKVALIGTAFAGWSVIFNWQFAIVLIVVIMFHEYGHVQAMKKFGIPTKGFYLIPFVGGVAIGDKAKSEWQELYISLMGPVYGLIMSLGFFLVYLIYNNNFIGLVASISALINLFNLFPIYPLDGGHAIKAMVFSGKKYWGIVCLLLGSAIGFAFSVKMGWVFISFFIVLGVIDLLFSWKELHAVEKEPMNRYGIIFSLVWYLSIVAIFLTIITIMANTNVPGTEIARVILRS